MCDAMPHTLRLKLLRAADLPIGDFGALGLGGKSDPYVQFVLRKTSQRSSGIPNCLDPVWGPTEVFEFPIEDPASECLEIRVYDEDAGSSDDLLGTAELRLAQFVPRASWGETTIPLDLAQPFAGKGHRSTVTLEISVVAAIVGVWENQRFRVVEKWTSEAFTPSDRRKYNRGDDDVGAETMDEVAPPIPSGLVAGEWEIDLVRGGADGWVYARKVHGPWQEKSFPLAMVRRRRWIKRCSYESAP